MFSYVKPGKYVAVCNRSDFDGHYTKVFDFPEKENGEDFVGAGVDAAWYFLNRVDFVACLEAVYPINIFLKVHNEFVLLEREAVVCDEAYRNYVLRNEHSPVKEREGA